jgi:DNA-binding XRE family transcriptional regulator
MITHFVEKIKKNVTKSVDTICDMVYSDNSSTKCDRKEDYMDAVKIGKRLADLRGEKTQEEVANDVGISTSALSMYECGERIPRDSIKVRLAKYYKKSVQAIFFTE